MRLQAAVGPERLAEPALGHSLEATALSWPVIAPVMATWAPVFAWSVCLFSRATASWPPALELGTRPPGRSPEQTTSPALRPADRNSSGARRDGGPAPKDPPAPRPHAARVPAVL